MDNYLWRQNLAADMDYRTTCINEVWWREIRNDEALYQPYDWYEPKWVRVHFEVCPACEGKGKYVNPSIDAHGLTREDFDEDPEFEESYWRGDYDITCNLCSGRNVVPVPEDKEIRKEILERFEALAEMAAEQWAEIQAGC